MSFPNHLILDLNVKSRRVNITHWTSNLTTSKTNPIFIDEINTNKLFLNSINTSSWIKFLQNTNLNSHTYCTPALQDISNTSATHPNPSKTSKYTPEDLININFLRYERLYTKLKYSRSPAFDIVSGGAAALLAGFLGFLISEKFGFELVDSGDFYYLFMYVVFASFLIKPFLYTLNVNESALSALSYRNILKFFYKLTLLFLKKVKTTLFFFI